MAYSVSSFLYLLLLIPIIGIYAICLLDKNVYTSAKLASKRDLTKEFILGVIGRSASRNREGVLLPYIPSTVEEYVKNINDMVHASHASKVKRFKIVGLIATIMNLMVSLFIYIVFDFSTNQYQFVQENHNILTYDFYLGLDGLSIYFVLLTTIIMPISLLSN